MNNNQTTSNMNTGTGSELFTRRSMESMSSPDQMKTYLRVTGMPIWIVVIAIIIALTGLLVWSSFVSITSYTDARGTVKDGVLVVMLEDDEANALEKSDDRFIARVGDAETTISKSGKTVRGKIVAAGRIGLPDGDYRVRIGYGKEKAIELLLN
jgi:hypothetical protein